MSLNRRRFLGTGVITATLATLPACWFGRSLYDSITKYVPVALLAFDRIIAILVEHGINTTALTEAVNRVKAALADIQSAVLEYQDAAEQARDTYRVNLAVALRIATERLKEFWELLHIPNEHLERTIKLLLDVIISTLTGFIARLAPGTPVAAQRFYSEPRVRTMKEFRQDFNSVLDQNGLSKYAI